MIENKFDGVWVRAIVTDEVTGREMVWFSGRDVSHLLGKRIQKSDLLKSGMAEGKDFAYVQVTDEVYFHLLTQTEHKILREWRQKDAETPVPHLGTRSDDAETPVRQSRTRSDDTEKPVRQFRTRSFFNGQQKRLLISESGFYRLIFTSRGMFAERMKRWLADEVIPSIRRYGQYQIPDDHAIWEVFEEMESKMALYSKVIENAAERITVADMIGGGVIGVNSRGEKVINPNAPMRKVA